MNKPVWIVCADEVHKEAVLYNVCHCHGGKCPPEHVDVNTGLCKCPHDEKGLTLSCTQCWSQYIDVEVADDGK